MRVSQENHRVELVDSGSGAGLAGSIAKVYERQQPWFGFYWAATEGGSPYPVY